jgi:hypothetical protein
MSEGLEVNRPEYKGMRAVVGLMGSFFLMHVMGWADGLDWPRYLFSLLLIAGLAVRSMKVNMTAEERERIVQANE